MALPPSVPTSFVPYSASAAARKFRFNFTGLFAIFAYFVFACVLVAAVGLFFYERILAGEQATKDKTLAAAEATIDKGTVDGFLRLSNRLSSSKTLLDKHIAFSSFFSVLENLLPSTTRISSLHFSLAENGDIKLSGSGIAKSFNALAATSIKFAGENRIKNAIFSGIAIGANNTVSFSFSALLDPSLVVFAPNGITPSTPVKTPPAVPEP